MCQTILLYIYTQSVYIYRFLKPLLQKYSLCIIQKNKAKCLVFYILLICMVTSLPLNSTLVVNTPCSPCVKESAKVDF